MSFAAIVDEWVAWNAARGSAEAGDDIAPRLAAFVADHCRRHDIPSTFYLGAAALELA
jgi:hypothetical protein